MINIIIKAAESFTRRKQKQLSYEQKVIKHNNNMFDIWIQSNLNHNFFCLEKSILILLFIVIIIT